MTNIKPETTETDVLIVGAGFTGLACACAIVSAGKGAVRVTVIDQKPPPPPLPARRPVMDTTGNRLTGDLSANVIAASPATRALLEEVGAWGLIDAACIVPYKKMQVFDGTGAGAISFDAAEAGVPVLGYILDQRALIAGLRRRAEQMPGVTLCWQQTWQGLVRDGDGYRMMMAEGRDTKARLVVGADGSSSRIRELVGLRKLSWPYHQKAVVCLARTATAHGGVARQWFTPTGPVAMLPLPESDLAAVIWSTSDWQATLELDDADFCKALTQVSEGFSLKGQVLAVSGRLSFPLMQQQALRYVSQGIALIGDAAHTIHPLAGQGANLGFADARELAVIVRQSKIEGKSPGDIDLLRRYEARRKVANQLVAASMEGFHRLFTAGNPALAFLRNKGLRLVDGNSRLKKLAVDAAMGIY